MVGNINSPYRFMQNYNSSCEKVKVNPDLKTHNENLSKKESLRIFSEKTSIQSLQVADNNVKTSIFSNCITQQTQNSDMIFLEATTEIEKDESFSMAYNLLVLASTDAYGGSMKGYSVGARVMESSTAENPVVYVETWEGGVNKAYQVEINKIDLNNATRVEIAAMLEYNKGSINEYTFLNLININICPDDTPSSISMTDHVNFFSECNKYMSYVNKALNPPVGLYVSSDTSMQEQFLGVAEKMTVVKERWNEAMKSMPMRQGTNSTSEKYKDLRNIADTLKPAVYRTYNAKSDQTQIWDDIFDERDERLSERRAREDNN